MISFEELVEHVASKFPAWTEEEHHALGALLYIKILHKDFEDSMFEASAEVDKLWCQFICNTKHYGLFCMHVADQYIHRTPKSTNLERYNATRYMVAQYVDSLDLWPAALTEEDQEDYVPPTIQKRARTYRCYAKIGAYNFTYNYDDTTTVGCLYQHLAKLNYGDVIASFGEVDLVDNSDLLYSDLGIMDGSSILVRTVKL